MVRPKVKKGQQHDLVDCISSLAPGNTKYNIETEEKKDLNLLKNTNSFKKAKIEKYSTVHFVLIHFDCFYFTFNEKEMFYLSLALE